MKIGDYVRTIDGIWVIDAIKNGCLQVRKKGHYTFFNTKEITKSSSNIIDLIEEDDFVNNQMVWHTKKDNKGKYLVMYLGGDVIRENEIYEVVTREQIDSIKYEIE